MSFNDFNDATFLAGIEKESQADWKEANLGLGRANPGMTFARGTMCLQRAEQIYLCNSMQTGKFRVEHGTTSIPHGFHTT
jgi:hypothetical protein